MIHYKGGKRRYQILTVCIQDKQNKQANVHPKGNFEEKHRNTAIKSIIETVKNARQVFRRG